MDFRGALTGQKNDTDLTSKRSSSTNLEGSTRQTEGERVFASARTTRGGQVNGDLVGSNMSFLLTTHKLNGRNYLEWPQSVKLPTDGRGKLGHLTGEVTRPALGDPNMAIWRSENSLVRAWLINSMEPVIGKTTHVLTDYQRCMGRGS